MKILFNNNSHIHFSSTGLIRDIKTRTNYDSDSGEVQINFKNGISIEIHYDIIFGKINYFLHVIDERNDSYTLIKTMLDVEYIELDSFDMSVMDFVDGGHELIINMENSTFYIMLNPKDKTINIYDDEQERLGYMEE